MTRRHAHWVFALAAAMLLGVTSGALAQSTGDMAAYEAHCAQCHGRDVGGLSRDTLRLAGDAVVTRKRGAPLRDFLDRHGRASPDEADRIYRLMRGYLTARDQ